MWRRQMPILDEDSFLDRPRTRLRTRIEVKRAINAKNSNLVSRLPPEILLVIFLALKDEHFVFDGSWSLSVENMDWVRVTHVCHHWRAVALNSPTLWTTLSITASHRQQQWATLALHRSKHALLSASVECIYLGNVFALGCPDYRSTVSSLGQNLSRCRDLTLRFVNDITAPPYDLFQQRHAPKLQSLSILSTSHRRSHRERPFILSDKTLEAPNLRHLELQNCRVDWHAALFQSITHLKLSSMFQASMDLPDFITFLSRIPSLEELDIDMSFFSADVPPSASSQKPTLRNLAKISLDAPLGIIVAFLSSFTSHPGVHIFAYSSTPVNSSAPLEFSEQLDRLLDVVSLHFPRSKTDDACKPLPLRKMTMYFDVYGAFSLQAHNAVHTPPDLASTRYVADCFKSSADAAIKIFLEPEFTPTRLPITSESEYQARMIRSIYTSIPLDDLVSITLGGYFTLNASVWAETFGLIGSLRTVVLNTIMLNIEALFDSLVYGVDDASTASPADTDTERTLKIPFRSLTSIVVHITRSPLDHALVASMESILRKRDTIGASLEFVALVLPPKIDSEVFEDVVVTLRPVEEEGNKGLLLKKL